MIAGIDHVALVTGDLEACLAFYARVLGAEPRVAKPRPGFEGVRQVQVGGAVLSLHQVANGVTPIARSPTPGSLDICFRWTGTIDDAQAHLASHGIAVEVGPAPRRTANGKESDSVYFRDPEGNLLELMAERPAG